MGFPGGSDGKESASNAGDLGSLSPGQEDPLQKGKATHCSILAWRIPRTEEPHTLHVSILLTRAALLIDFTYKMQIQRQDIKNFCVVTGEH